MRLDTPAIALTESRILYSDGHMDQQMDTQTYRLIPVYPQKHLFCRGIIRSTDLNEQLVVFLIVHIRSNSHYNSGYLRNEMKLRLGLVQPGKLTKI